MEDLAIIVSLMLLSEILFGLAVIIFAIVYRVKRKFANTTLVLLGLLALETVWAISLTPAFGYPALAALVIAVALRFIPLKK
ncbi:MAG: hypothetical protein ACKOWE_03295 [Micrococcales bacterium]